MESMRALGKCSNREHSPGLRPVRCVSSTPIASARHGRRRLGVVAGVGGLGVLRGAAGAVPARAAAAAGAPLKTRATLAICPPCPGSSPMAISTCVYAERCAAAAIRLSAGSFHHCEPTR